MQLLKTVLFGLSAFATLAAAQGGNLAFTGIPSEVTAGQPVTITYSGGNGPATIILREGDPGNLNTIATLTTSATGGSYTWTPSTSLPSGSRYALEIQQGGQINYSGQIAVAGGSGTAAPSASSVISSAASAISSASSAISSAQSSASSESVSSVISSVSSVVSSQLSSALTSIIASVNSSITAHTMTGTVGTGTTIPMSRNTTMVSPTLSSTTTDTATSTATSTRTTRTTSGTQTGASSTATGTGAPNANAAAGLSSPLALVLGAVAAMIYLN